MSACLDLSWEGKGRLGEGVGRVCIVRIDSLLLCGAFTIMKIELQSEESRTIIITLASVWVWLSSLSLDDIEMFLCLLEVLCRAITSFRPLILMQRSNPLFHSLDFVLVPKRTRLYTGTPYGRVPRTACTSY